MAPLSPVPPPLTPSQMQSVMQMVTQSTLLEAFGPAAFARDPNYQVRIGWPTEGQPAFEIDEDVCILRAVEDDDEINRTRDIAYNEINDATVQQLSTYIRVWRTFWIMYGPNSFDRARALRSGLYLQSISELLGVLNVDISAVMDISAPRRVPEPYAGGRWWERVDFDCQFNERVTEENVVSTVASSETLVYTQDSPDIAHPARDTVVTAP